MLSRHVAILDSHPFHWPSEADAAAFAQRLAGSSAIGAAYIELQGPLGAGKTTVVRHLLRALGVTGRIKSPTYAVVETYSLPALHISHFDFYRFDDPREWADAGLRDLFAAAGLKLAEWPEKVAQALPLADLHLDIQPQADGSRQVQAHAATAVGLDLLRCVTAASDARDLRGMSDASHTARPVGS